MRFLGVCCAAALGPAGLRPQDTEGRHAPGAQSGVGIKSSSSSFQTWSTPPSALIRRTFPRASKYWTTGRHSRLYDARRFSTIAGESIGFLRSFSRCANRCLQESCRCTWGKDRGCSTQLVLGHGLVWNCVALAERKGWEQMLIVRPPCDIPSGCCSFTGPLTVTRSSLRMLRRVAAFCRPLRPVLLLVSFPRSRSPVVGVLGLC